MSRFSTRTILASIAVALAFAAAAWADPPAQVGRLNLIQGDISFRPGSMDEWTPATLNYPLTTGDSLWTDEQSRGEVHLASAVLRLGPGTEMSFLDLDDPAVQVSLPQGTLSVRIRDLDEGETFEIDTPTMSMMLLARGSYRIDVSESGDTQATVNEGEGEIVVDGMSYPVRAGQIALVNQSTALAIQIRRAPGADEWDRWCDERDRREERVSSVTYVPRTLIGYEDLDWYGSWSDTSDYGPVWIPSSVPAGWAPYRFGRWAWVDPWGWTWIDREPWGFAPFHYGRWAVIKGRWVWVPGRIARRPVYAPALVIFIDAGSGTTVISGRIGWFPLGPREPYLPPYAASHAYIQKVNIPHVRVDGGQKLDPSKLRYAHRDQPHAYTVVAQQSFSHAHQVGDARVEIPDSELKKTRVSGSLAPVAPERESVFVTTKGEGKGPRPSAKTGQQKVVVKKVPPDPRTPFSAQQEELAKNPGRPVEPKQKTPRDENASASSTWVKQKPQASDV